MSAEVSTPASSHIRLKQTPVKPMWIRIRCISRQPYVDEQHQAMMTLSMAKPSQGPIAPDRWLCGGSYGAHTSRSAPRSLCVQAQRPRTVMEGLPTSASLKYKPYAVRVHSVTPMGRPLTIVS